MSKLVSFFSLFNLIGLFTIGQNISIVKVLPGIGIVFNNDSILLQSTTMKDLCKILNIKDSINTDGLSVTLWDGVDSKTGKEVSGSIYEKEIHYESIKFGYSDNDDAINLKLEWITLKENENLKIIINNQFGIGTINPEIKKIFPHLKKKDFISDDKLTYKLYSSGISFKLEKGSNDELKIVEISIHNKIE